MDSLTEQIVGDQNIAQEKMEKSATMAELTVAGSILIDPASVRRVTKYVTPSDFKCETYKRIVEAAIAIDHDGKEPDPILIRDYCVKHGWNINNNTLYDIIALTPTATSDIEYAKIVSQEGLRRSAQNTMDAYANQIAKLDTDPTEILTKLKSDIETLLEGHDEGDVKNPQQRIEMFMRDVDDRINGRVNYVPTGFNYLDDILCGGLRRGDVDVIAARPGVGKTILGLAIAMNCQLPVLYVSEELMQNEITARELSNYTSINAGTLGMRRYFTDDEMDALADGYCQIALHNIYCTDKNLTVSQIENRARQIENLGMIVIDHMGLVVAESQMRNQNRYQVVGEISRAIKRLAKNLEVPILEMVQLNRQSEQRENKRPALADLRDSGDIEQDASVVMLLYRDLSSDGDENVYTPGDLQTLEINVAKNRHGITKKIFMGIDPGTNTVVNLSEDDCELIRKEMENSRNRNR